MRRPDPRVPTCRIGSPATGLRSPGRASRPLRAPGAVERRALLRGSWIGPCAATERLAFERVSASACARPTKPMPRAGDAETESRGERGDEPAKAEFTAAIAGRAVAPIAGGESETQTSSAVSRRSRRGAARRPAVCAEVVALSGASPIGRPGCRSQAQLHKNWAVLARESGSPLHRTFDTQAFRRPGCGLRPGSWCSASVPKGGRGPVAAGTRRGGGAAGRIRFFPYRRARLGTALDYREPTEWGVRRAPWFAQPAGGTPRRDPEGARP